MRAVVVRTFGGPEVLDLIEVPVPEPGPGQVRIRVAAAAVNPVDLATRAGVLTEAGLMAPRAVTGIGWDVAGTVDAVGADVTGFTPGDAVIGLRDLLDRDLGGYAEYVVLDAGAVAPAPAGRTPVEAATLPLNGLTATQALDALDLAPGRTLLVTGAAGAVGGFAVELAARHRGLRVLAVAGAADADAVRALGATWVVDRAVPDLADAARALVPGGVDAALHTAGPALPALAAVRNRGGFVTVVGGVDPKPLRGIAVRHTWIAADGPALARLSAADLTLRVADTLPLDRAAEAHARLERGGLRGRLVLTAPGTGGGS
ncbi:NADP-dependent oxidoreductase [Nocardia thailandica]|uniref:NADP-dependent oxidoreductase n=1 Tax=Nocardia thailandica TaxID=257275 RepID=A0ABW6PT43_9NOCA